MEFDNKKYVSLIEEGGIFSYSLAKGTFILPCNGFLLWNNIRVYLDKKFSEFGVKNVILPTLIPISLLEKEKEHVDGFSPELFLVRRKKIDDDSLEDGSAESLALRPTSEVLFYEWFARSLQTYKQLPFLYNQWGQVFRAEKNTKPFLRNTEFLWQEGHTLHYDNDEARKFTLQILDIYKEYIEKVLCIAAIVGVKTNCEKFAGAMESYTVECLLPDYQCLQLATSHYFGSGFSEAFGVKFRDHSNELKLPSSTSWGTSTRAIGALVLSHSDEFGLVFPFDIAPVQIAFIRHGGVSENISSYINKIYDELSSAYRCKIYENSNQFFENVSLADKEGCPIKIIIGKNEFKKGALSLSLRIFPKERTEVDRSGLYCFIENSRSKIADYLYERSLLVRESHTFKIRDNDEFLEKKDLEKGLFLVPFCNIVSCEEKFRRDFQSFSFRCISPNDELLNNKCAFCNSKASAMAYVGRSY